MEWVNSLAFKLYTGPTGKYVIHMDGKKKTKIDVPSTVTTKANARNWIKKHVKPVARAPAPRRVATVTAKNQPVVNKVLFNCSSKFFKQMRRTNGATGFMANKVVPLPNKRLYTVKNGAFNIKPGIAKIGSGQQGVVFLGYTNEKATYGSGVIIKVCPEEPAAPKQNSVVEFEIQKKLYEVVPRHVPKPFALIKCKDYVNPEKVWPTNRTNRYNYSTQYVEFSEYADGGSLYGWLSKMGSRVTEGLLQSIITQVLRTLDKIMRKYPDFRHNDLHLDNVLVKQGAWTKYPTVVIADFGWARLSKKGSNPLVNRESSAAAQAGIGPLTSSRYDMHLFLNEFQKWVNMHNPERFPKTLEFIYRTLPEGYRGNTNTYINDGRLKYNIQYPGLPKLSDVLKDKYILGARQYLDDLEEGPKRLARKANNTSPNVKANVLRTPIKSFKFPSPPRPPKPRAKTPSPARSLPKNLANVSPKTFLKLSPASKAKVMAARRAKAGAPKGKLLAVPTVANAITARKQASPRKRINTAAQNVRISPRVLRSNKFNKLRARMLVNNNRAYNNRWAEARNKAISVIKNRLRRGLPMFTPSPPKPLPSPLSPLGPPPKRVSPPKRAAGGQAAKNLKMRMNGNRVKLLGNGGRVVYANGSATSMEYLKGLAAKYGVSTKGLRSKADIAKAIFSS